MEASLKTNVEVKPKNLPESISENGPKNWSADSVIDIIIFKSTDKTKTKHSDSVIRGYINYQKLKIKMNAERKADDKYNSYSHKFLPEAHKYLSTMKAGLKQLPEGPWRKKYVSTRPGQTYAQARTGMTTAKDELTEWTSFELNAWDTVSESPEYKSHLREIARNVNAFDTEQDESDDTSPKNLSDLFVHLRKGATTTSYMYLASAKKIIQDDNPGEQPDDAERKHWNTSAQIYEMEYKIAETLADDNISPIMAHKMKITYRTDTAKSVITGITRVAEHAGTAAASLFLNGADVAPIVNDAATLASMILKSPMSALNYWLTHNDTTAITEYTNWKNAAAKARTNIEYSQEQVLRHWKGTGTDSLYKAATAPTTGRVTVTAEPVASIKHEPLEYKTL